MVTFTLGTASQATGMAKSSILRAIKAGRLSATRNEDGTTWNIDPVELARVFPLVAIPGQPQPQPQPAPALDATTDVLVAELRAMLAGVKRERDRWQEAHERASATLAKLAQLQLPAPAPLADQDATPAAPPKRRWWKRAAPTRARARALSLKPAFSLSPIRRFSAREARHAARNLL
jgi:hypothetical protein